MQVLIGDSFMDRKKRNLNLKILHFRIEDLIKFYNLKGEKGFCMKNSHKTRRRRRYMQNGMCGRFFFFNNQQIQVLFTFINSKSFYLL